MKSKLTKLILFLFLSIPFSVNCEEQFKVLNKVEETKRVGKSFKLFHSLVVEETDSGNKKIIEVEKETYDKYKEGDTTKYIPKKDKTILPFLAALVFIVLLLLFFYNSIIFK